MEPLNESSIVVKEVEQSKVIWPSASEKRSKPEEIAWLSKTKDQREREIEADLDDNDYGDNDSFE